MSGPSLQSAQGAASLSANTSLESDIPRSDASMYSQYDCIRAIEKKFQTQTLNPPREADEYYEYVEAFNRKMGASASESKTDTNTANSNPPSDTDASNPQTDEDIPDWSSVDSEPVHRERKNRLFVGDDPAAFSKKHSAKKLGLKAATTQSK